MKLQKSGLENECTKPVELNKAKGKVKITRGKDGAYKVGIVFVYTPVIERFTQFYSIYTRVIEQSRPNFGEGKNYSRRLSSLVSKFRVISF